VSKQTLLPFMFIKENDIHVKSKKNDTLFLKESMESLWFLAVACTFVAKKRAA